MRNVHERHIRVSAKRVGAVLETRATDDDRLWPGTAWAPMVLDRGLEPGSRGGHDGIRYTVTAHDPGRHVEFAFDRPIGIDGARSPSPCSTWAMAPPFCVTCWRARRVGR